ncbi:flagellar motor stator protein MotA [Sansalvadorimonas sp. 2012CJ34-2]|uniref:Flagellar motor stator protein MotA n=1 Tax=Parendozoicomonas callyspongiae TaxID=2942213 RepID=A0ABT0PNN9_9GAMM|nr:motility-associated protein [Sansalvadorimonas sp. 2012CJ34-2]MCL6272068.1 flagellar motor stator protein MotA [Sansalvadorimonas sp. 2012CJ34-2]
MLKMIGFAITLASVMGGFFLGNGVLATLWQPAYILIVVGGAIGAFFSSNPGEVLQLTKHYLGRALLGQRRGREDYEKLLVLLHDLFQVIRRKGRQALEEHIESPERSDLFKRSGFLESPRLVTYICDNLRMTNLGQISARELEALLESELDCYETEQNQSANSLKMAADATPGFGIVASVLGVIIAMSSMNGPISVLGMAVAGSMVGTMLGMLSCYGILTPMINLVSHSIKDEVMLFECVKAALVANCAGRHPIVSVDAGRRVLYSGVQPSFVELEQRLQGSGA